MDDRPKLREPPALSLVHPDLVRLMRYYGVFPPGDRGRLSEDELARAINLAIEMSPPDEQARIASRIMSEEEIAEERLQRPEVQEMGRHATITREEREFLLRMSPDSATEQEDEDEGNNEEHGVEGEHVKSEKAKGKEPAQQQQQAPCIVCLGAGETHAPCGCSYCFHCIRNAIRFRLHSGYVFPPQCCQTPIDGETVRHTGNPGLFHLYHQVAAEAAVPDDSRKYCHNPHCRTFLAPLNDGRHSERCRACGLLTCKECLGPGHLDEEWCPGRDLSSEEGNIEDENEPQEDMWEYMDNNGLVSCPRCRVIIELYSGCNHLTCTQCEAEFCYLCGLRWHTCSCPNYNAPEFRVPMRNRPGKKPRRYRRRQDQEQPPPIPGLRIPMLRPLPGEFSLLRQNLPVARPIYRMGRLEYDDGPEVTSPRILAEIRRRRALEGDVGRVDEQDLGRVAGRDAARRAWVHDREFNAVEAAFNRRYAAQHWSPQQEAEELARAHQNPMNLEPNHRNFGAWPQEMERRQHPPPREVQGLGHTAFAEQMEAIDRAIHLQQANFHDIQRAQARTGYSETPQAWGIPQPPGWPQPREMIQPRGSFHIPEIPQAPRIPHATLPEARLPHARLGPVGQVWPLGSRRYSFEPQQVNVQNGGPQPGPDMLQVAIGFSWDHRTFEARAGISIEPSWWHLTNVQRVQQVYNNRPLIPDATWMARRSFPPPGQAEAGPSREREEEDRRIHEDEQLLFSAMDHLARNPEELQSMVERYAPQRLEILRSLRAPNLESHLSFYGL
ncbi:hypothetical protein G7046_g5437 [Stylonectria norvegica]|nr:hypothetical protein G7046_g5437 [Stylonectria norvegica]